ncbi:MAG: nucleotidyltransferase family protein [Pseudomonadota bacterium]
MSLPKLLPVILAAGNSSRLGSPKQLLAFNDSDLLSHASATITNAVGLAPLVVLGANFSDIFLKLHKKPDYLTINSRWSEGMSSSIQRALAVATDEVDGLLLAVCDQPLISVNHFRAMADGFKRLPEAVHASVYPSGKPGVPAVVPRRLFAALNLLEGDRGAQALLFNDSTLVPYNCPEAQLDIDTEADQQSLLAHKNV